MSGRPSALPDLTLVPFSGQVEGRLGPSTVVLDHTGGFEGLLLVDDDLLGVSGEGTSGSPLVTPLMPPDMALSSVLILMSLPYSCPDTAPHCVSSALKPPRHSPETPIQSPPQLLSAKLSPIMPLSQKLLTWIQFLMPQSDPVQRWPRQTCATNANSARDRVCAWRATPLFFSIQVIGHSNFGTIRSTTCVYKGELPLPRLRELGGGLGGRWPSSLTCCAQRCSHREVGLRGAHLLPGPHADRLVHHQLPL